MHELYKLKDMLVKELEEYGSRGDLSASTLQTIDTLAHAAKNVCKIIEDSDEGQSGRWYPNSYDDGMSGRRPMPRNMAYRGMPNGGSYARRRDRMGRYSGDGDMVAELRELMENAPDDRTRQEFQRFIGKIEGNM